MITHCFLCTKQNAAELWAKLVTDKTGKEGQPLLTRDVVLHTMSLVTAIVHIYPSLSFFLYLGNLHFIKQHKSTSRTSKLHHITVIVNYSSSSSSLSRLVQPWLNHWAGSGGLCFLCSIFNGFSSLQPTADWHNTALIGAHFGHLLIVAEWSLHAGGHWQGHGLPGISRCLAALHCHPLLEAPGNLPTKRSTSKH